MIALLTGAVMFALGLFFGWLLHRERVERTLYEDAVRGRDRANTTLAETAARLELANKDVIRLREQLTETQRRLEARDDAVAELRAELDAERGRIEAQTAVADGEHQLDGDRDPRDVPVSVRARRPSGGRSLGPPEAQLFDELNLGELDLDEVDITEEVAMPTASPSADVVEADVVEGSPSADVVEADVVGGSPSADAVDAVATDDASVADDGDQVGPGDVEPTAGIGEPLVVEPVAAVLPETPPTGDSTGAVVDVDEPEGDALRSPDDLQQISGVGPALERALHGQGITTFRQLASLDEADIEALHARSPRLATGMRRGSWVSQARRLHIDAYGDEP